MRLFSSVNIVGDCFKVGDLYLFNKELLKIYAIEVRMAFDGIREVIVLHLEYGSSFKQVTLDGVFKATI